MARTKTEKSESNPAADTNPKVEARKAKREAKRAALKSVLAFVKENAEEGSDLMTAVAVLTPGTRGGGGGGRGGAFATAKSAVLDLIRESGTVNEEMVWTEFKLGRAEMRKVSVQLIKRAKSPEERVWISFDAETGDYTLDADNQADAPENWTGYTPVEVEDIDI